jgi:hypothetical protein
VIADAANQQVAISRHFLGTSIGLSREYSS